MGIWAQAGSRRAAVGWAVEASSVPAPSCRIWSLFGDNTKMIFTFCARAGYANREAVAWDFELKRKAIALALNCLLDA